MIGRARRATNTGGGTQQRLVTAAATSFVANCCVGILASLPRSRPFMRRIRWAHHALYVSTATLTGAATGAAILTGHPSRAPLLATTLPLMLMPRFRGRSPAHALTAVATAPAYAAAIIRTRSTTTPRTRRRR